MKKLWVPILILLLSLQFSACKQDNYSLYYVISNESTRTLDFRFVETPELIDTVFVIAPAVMDTLISYTDLGPTIPAPNCGVGSVSQITVQSGGTLTKDLAEPSNWIYEIDQRDAISTCTFVIRDEDIQ